MNKDNWIKWLQARIPELKESHNEFWISQAIDGYLQDNQDKALIKSDVVGRREQFTFEDMRNAFDAGAWEHHIHSFDSWIKTQK